MKIRILIGLAVKNKQINNNNRLENNNKLHNNKDLVISKTMSHNTCHNRKYQHIKNKLNQLIIMNLNNNKAH